MNKQEFEAIPLIEGWKRVSADEWAEFTSDYNTTSSEREMNGLDTMMCSVGLLAVSLVHYVRIDGVLERFYAVNAGAAHLLQHAKRKFYCSAKEE